MTASRNREKAIIIGILKNKYPLPVLLQKLNLSGSSHYYQRKQLTSSDKHAALRIHISELFSENPDQKWLTDVTEFIIPAGKVSLSPIVDCFDGMLPAWKIAQHRMQCR